MATDTDVTLEVATFRDRPLLENLLELYLHDLSEVFPIEIDNNGRFGYERLHSYWSEPDRRFPFLVRYRGRIAGFVFVTRGSPVSEDPNVFDIAEFFVMRQFRRHGVGREAAFHAWDHHHGDWTVRVSEGNAGGLEFWSRMTAEYANGAQESRRPGTPHDWRVFSFRSSGRAGQ
jgi:predicted acetyltransferase